jgi:AcrR family transcriptional regulator
MARPKSELKRDAILNAAIHIFAERGLAAAPTSEISKQAGVAEGTLFTYFRTKDDLINALYQEIKLELAGTMMAGFPHKKSVRARLRHVWDSYVNWGVTNPEQRRVLAQLQVSGMLTKESIAAGSAPFVEIQNITRDAIEQHILRLDIPLELISKMLGALAEAIMDLIISKPAMAKKYRNGGFEIYWAGISRK